MFSVVSKSPEVTRRIGELLGELLKPGDTVCLYGDLGAGKTNFSFGIAQGLAVEADYVPSPTFTFVNEYRGRIPFYHIDLYRLTDPGELDGIGFAEYIESDGATVIEWAERADDELPADRLSVYLSYLSPESRELGFLAEGGRYEDVLARLTAKLAEFSLPPSGEDS